MPPCLNKVYYYLYNISFCQWFTFCYLCYFFIINDWKFSKQTRPYKTISNLTDKDFLPANRRRWNLIAINLFPMYINFQQQFWFKNVQLTSVSAMMKAATANTCMSVMLNQSYLDIPTLPNEQPHGRSKADAWRLIHSFHEINKSWPNMRCLLENDSKVWLQPRYSFFMFPKVDHLFRFLLEMPTKSRRSLSRSCRVTWVRNKQASSTHSRQTCRQVSIYFWTLSLKLTEIVCQTRRKTVNS